MGFTDGTFSPGIHMCYIYNDENERNRLIYRFLESGLLHGENVLYFMDINTVDEIRERKAALGMDRLYERKDGRFSFATAWETYCPTGVFDPDKMLEKLTEFYEQSVNEGYTGHGQRVKCHGQQRAYRVRPDSWSMKHVSTLSSCNVQSPESASMTRNVSTIRRFGTFWPSIP
jgi:hypothetical protein